MKRRKSVDLSVNSQWYLQDVHARATIDLEQQVEVSSEPETPVPSCSLSEEPSLLLPSPPTPIPATVPFAVERSAFEKVINVDWFPIGLGIAPWNDCCFNAVVNRIVNSSLSDQGAEQGALVSAIGSIDCVGLLYSQIFDLLKSFESRQRPFELRLVCDTNGSNLDHDHKDQLSLSSTSFRGISTRAESVEIEKRRKDKIEQLYLEDRLFFEQFKRDYLAKQARKRRQEYDEKKSRFSDASPSNTPTSSSGVNTPTDNASSSLPSTPGLSASVTRSWIDAVSRSCDTLVSNDMDSSNGDCISSKPVLKPSKSEQVFESRRCLARLKVKHVSSKSHSSSHSDSREGSERRSSSLSSSSSSLKKKMKKSSKRRRRERHRREPSDSQWMQTIQSTKDRRRLRKHLRRVERRMERQRVYAVRGNRMPHRDSAETGHSGSDGSDPPSDSELDFDFVPSLIIAESSSPDMIHDEQQQQDWDEEETSAMMMIGDDDLMLFPSVILSNPHCHPPKSPSSKVSSSLEVSTVMCSDCAWFAASMLCHSLMNESHYDSSGLSSSLDESKEEDCSLITSAVNTLGQRCFQLNVFEIRAGFLLWKHHAVSVPDLSTMTDIHKHHCCIRSDKFTLVSEKRLMSHCFENDESLIDWLFGREKYSRE